MRVPSFQLLPATAGLLLAATATAPLLHAPAAKAQRSCQTVVAYVAPSPLRCQQIGENHMGKPIWLCC